MLDCGQGFRAREKPAQSSASELRFSAGPRLLSPSHLKNGPTSIGNFKAVTNSYSSERCKRCGANGHLRVALGLNKTTKSIFHLCKDAAKLDRCIWVKLVSISFYILCEGQASFLPVLMTNSCRSGTFPERVRERDQRPPWPLGLAGLSALHLLSFFCCVKDCVS